MNKAHWLNVALDGTVEDEKLRFLEDMSYELTKNEEVGIHFLAFSIRMVSSITFLLLR